jgi:putative ABC transport system permease protein
MLSRLRSLLARISTTFMRGRLDRQIEEEFESHLELLTERFIRQGMTRREAKYAAKRQFGGIAQMKQNCYESSSIPVLEWLLKDVLYALRTLRKNSGFALTAILTLAIGIGANTAIFSVVRAVVLKPLGYRNPDGLVQLSMESSRKLATFTPARYRQLKAQTRSFAYLGAFGLPQNMVLTAGSEFEQITAARVSANFLRVLGVRPLVGRDFRDEEDMPGGDPVAMISAELWAARFGSDANVIGKTAVLDSQPRTIVGVIPSGFEFPFAGVDVWLPRPEEWKEVRAQDWDRTASLTGFARLRPGVSIEQAATELAVLNDQYVAANGAFPDAQAGARMRVERLADAVVTPVRAMLWILLGAVGFVLLIACANLASLMLARATSRSREFAIRSALGAGRGRLMTQSLTESILLALAGAGLGLGLAAATLAEVPRQNAVPLPRVGEIRLDGFVLAFTFIVAISTGVLVGILPSLRASQPILVQALREHGVRMSQPPGLWAKVSSRSLLVVAQIALSLVLSIGTGLLLKSLMRLRHVDLGFQPANVLTMRITLAPARYSSGQKITTFFDDLVERVQTLPGIQYAAVARSLPTLPYQLVALQAAEQAQTPYGQRPLGALQTVSGNYFQLMGASLRAGRTFTEQDLKGGRPVLVVNETLARKFWPNYTRDKPPIGQQLQLGRSAYPTEIVGIVGDLREGGAAFPVPAEVYLPARFSPPQTAYLLIRGDKDPLPLADAIRRQILAMDRDQTVSAVKSMNELIDSSLGQQRVTTMLVGVFALLAVSLAAIGLYGVMAYAVAQRVAEIGIRRALGARPTDILRLIAGQGLGLSLAGILLGWGGALALTRFLRTLLFGVGAADPGTFAEIALLLLLVALAASYLPARRATRIDPMTALR